MPVGCVNDRKKQLKSMYKTIQMSKKLAPSSTNVSWIYLLPTGGVQFTNCWMSYLCEHEAESRLCRIFGVCGAAMLNFEKLAHLKKSRLSGVEKTKNEIILLYFKHYNLFSEIVGALNFGIETLKADEFCNYFCCFGRVLMLTTNRVKNISA